MQFYWQTGGVKTCYFEYRRKSLLLIFIGTGVGGGALKLIIMEKIVKNLSWLM